MSVPTRNTPYESALTIAVPMALMPIAAPIAQAFDPLSGGAHSFDILRATDANGDTWALCHSPATAETAAVLPFLKANPTYLYGSVTLDFAARWPDETPPTLEECTAFCEGIKLTTGMSLADSLAEFGFTLVVPAE